MLPPSAARSLLTYKLNQLNYSTSLNGERENKKSTLNPWFVTGFIDGEGSFTVSIRKNSKYSLGWSVEIQFKIGLHQKDIAILEQIQSYFGVGKIYISKNSNSILYNVFSKKDLLVLINHFDKYPLLTQKRTDYELWKQVFNIIQNQEHLSIEGLSKIVAIKAILNTGSLTDELKGAFPDINLIARPLVELVTATSINANWLVGFVSGEGSFGVQVYKAKTNIGEAVRMVFTITQHIRDEQLMKSLVELLDCGNVTRRKREEAVDLRVTKQSDINTKIIPFFEKYPILGIKSIDFQDWCKVAKLMYDKSHQTKEGLNIIREIKAAMNKGRII